MFGAVKICLTHTVFDVYQAAYVVTFIISKMKENFQVFGSIFKMPEIGNFLLHIKRL